MLFNSLEFLIFFIIVTALFFALPKRLRNYLLLITSYIFYSWWNFKLLFLILFTTLVSYLSALFISKKEKGRKLVFVLSLFIILGALIFFKYYNFFAGGIGLLANFITKKEFNLTLDIILPVGISFYTFQTLSYVIDVYKKKIDVEKNVFIYALFVSFFPQLVAGPIERPNELIPQLKQDHTFNSDDFIEGFKMMATGFFLKIAVADMIGVYVNKVYENINDANGLLVLSTTFLFSIQILCDFKGYSDIAKGIARVYGIRLSDNFNKPYSAVSVRDFWRRWHITLSTWFKDYLYIPLGGSRVNLFRHILNILIVFALSGLWHGANITFVIWGLIHALYQIIEIIISKLKKKEKEETIFIHRLKIVFTYLLVVFAWIFFRSNNISDSMIAIGKIFTDYSFTKDYFSYDSRNMFPNLDERSNN